jgi:hypothetical protein
MSDTARRSNLVRLLKSAYQGNGNANGPQKSYEQAFKPSRMKMIQGKAFRKFFRDCFSHSTR